ncbi:hypothetical protein ACFWXO_30880 [Kitasatospora sp. NPDC059088]|uniref:hypothetical protein n=1 Tax=Kitasatospora sp. NPDC059088 TaxID=3346722 RepID=UPI0036B4658F
MASTITPPGGLQPVILTAEECEFAAFALVESMSHRKMRDFFGPTEGLSAVLLFAESPQSPPMRFEVSRLVGEIQWHADIVLGANGFPHLRRPFGSGRGMGGTLEGPVLAPPAVPFVAVLPQLAELLDRAAVAEGLVEQTGTGVPMYLRSAR